jgi:hypothetical protein
MRLLHDRSHRYRRLPRRPELQARLASSDRPRSSFSSSFLPLSLANLFSLPSSSLYIGSPSPTSSSSSPPSAPCSAPLPSTEKTTPNSSFPSFISSTRSVSSGSRVRLSLSFF